MKKIKVEILEPAQIELEEIITIYANSSGIKSAHRLLNKIYDAVAQLAVFPLSGLQLRDKQLSLAGYRLLVVEEYLCIYRIVEKTVYVYHIVHGSTNYPQLLKSYQSSTFSD